MATPPPAGADRAWRGLALSVTALAHGVSLGAPLLDGDRLLLVRNPALHSFGGLLSLLADGRVVAHGVALPLRDHAPLGALAAWLSWQWFRGGPAAQHALSVALLVGVAAALFALLRATRC
ncbi:MAG: hypothetical protein JWM10_1732, partial [Myxococcaceae bacterium]|nr:hypothetical protein [Myxococcaceae bacterium]